MTDSKNPNTVSDGKPSKRRRWIEPGLIGVVGLAALIAGLALSPVSAAARAGLFGRGNHDSPEEMQEHMDFAADWILDKLDADEEQSTRVKAILADSLSDMQGMHAEHEAVQQALVAELTAENVDRAALERIRSEQFQKFDEVSRRITTTVADIADVLRPEQRAELAEFAERSHGHRGWRSGRRHGWH